MLKKIALFAAASALPLTAASAQDTAMQPSGTQTTAPADSTAPADATAPATTDATAPAADTTAPAADTTAPAADTATEAATTQAAPTADAIVAATAADLSAGATVRDAQGGEVGTVESATATHAIVSTGTNRVQLPLGSFGKNSAGLVIGVTKAELDAQAAASTPQSATPQ